MLFVQFPMERLRLLVFVWFLWGSTDSDQEIFFYIFTIIFTREHQKKNKERMQYMAIQWKALDVNRTHDSRARSSIESMSRVCQRSVFDHDHVRRHILRLSWFQTTRCRCSRFWTSIPEVVFKKSIALLMKTWTRHVLKSNDSFSSNKVNDQYEATFGKFRFIRSLSEAKMFI